MQLTCTAWLESLNTRDDGWGKKTYESCQKDEFFLLHGLLSTGRYVLGVSFMTHISQIYAHV
jgi:hypothetical protein